MDTPEIPQEVRERIRAQAGFSYIDVRDPLDRERLRYGFIAGASSEYLRAQLEIARLNHNGRYSELTNEIERLKSEHHKAIAAYRDQLRERVKEHLTECERCDDAYG